METFFDFKGDLPKMHKFEPCWKKSIFFSRVNFMNDFIVLLLVTFFFLKKIISEKEIVRKIGENGIKMIGSQNWSFRSS